MSYMHVHSCLQFKYEYTAIPPAFNIFSQLSILFLIKQDPCPRGGRGAGAAALQLLHRCADHPRQITHGRPPTGRLCYLKRERQITLCEACIQPSVCFACQCSGCVNPTACLLATDKRTPIPPTPTHKTHTSTHNSGLRRRGPHHS